MASIKTEYGAASGLTCSLASLASSATAGRESTPVDNSSDKFLDARVVVKVKTSASGLANDKAVYVYVAGSVDDGSTWEDAVAGTGDAAVTLNDPTQLALLGTIFCPASSTSYTGGPWSVAQALGGLVLPKKWLIVVRNYTGQNLDGTEGSHAKQYQGVYASVN